MTFNQGAKIHNIKSNVQWTFRCIIPYRSSSLNVDWHAKWLPYYKSSWLKCCFSLLSPFKMYFPVENQSVLSKTLLFCWQHSFKNNQCTLLLARHCVWFDWTLQFRNCHYLSKWNSILAETNSGWLRTKSQVIFSSHHVYPSGCPVLMGISHDLCERAPVENLQLD